NIFRSSFCPTILQPNYHRARMLGYNLQRLGATSSITLLDLIQWPSPRGFMPIDFLDIPFFSVLAVSRCLPRWTVYTRLSWRISR
ncbi:hypothetical protein, partial [Pseudomonas aeruginosa]